MSHCRQFLATGGTNPADCQIMRISDNNGASSSALDMEPVQTLVVSCLSQSMAHDVADARGMCVLHISVSLS